MKTTLPAGPWTQTHRASGFTLIELMVTVAIVAVLTALAYPSYRNYVIRGALVSATQGLSAVQANMERYFQDNRTYLAANSYTPPCSTATTYGTFTISCPATLTNPPTGNAAFTGTTLTATSFQLEAVGSGNTAGFSFFIDYQNNEASTVTSPAPSGWTNCLTGWETRAGQC